MPRPSPDSACGHPAGSTPRQRWSRGWLVALVGLGHATGLAAQTISFNEHIQPILSEHCFHCHGPDASSRKGDLRLDRAEHAVLPRKEGGAAIVKGDAKLSLVMQRITASNPKELMPPADAHKPLSAQQIERLRRWIEAGAEYEEHWAFVPPVQPPLPPVQRPGWLRNGVDAFVLAKLEAAGFTAAEEADKYALLRRVTFDLTGLPPSLAEIGDFAADQSVDAYEKVVDRLLASPRFGEHRARYWLDAVRYGDTNGEHADTLRNTWPYRDYVIRSFNQNKPFDQFVIEQVAGDLLPPTKLDQIVATAFNRLHTTTNEGGSVVEEVYLHKLRDRTQTTATVFLGLTMACASCHDHKFDPVSQREFYQLSAFFNNMPDSVYDANQAANEPLVSVPPDHQRAAADRILVARAAIQEELNARVRAADARVQAWLESGAAARVPRVSNEAIFARFRFDEGAGQTVRNSAPGADPVDYALGGKDHSWGGSTRPLQHWTGLRFGVQTSLSAPTLGDFDTTDAFSVAGWFLPRERSGTQTGSFISRMAKAYGNRGWDLFWQSAPTRRPARPALKKKAAAAPAPEKAEPAEEMDDETRPEPQGYLVANLVHQDKKSAITVRSKRTISRKEWVHLAFTYDGSGKAAGVRLYIDGQPQPVDVLVDTLAGSIRTPAPLQLARRTGGDASPETSFQDVRLYARALAADEVRALKHADLVAEIVARPTEQWTLDQRSIVHAYFFEAVDERAIALRGQLARLDTDFQRATAGGTAISVSRERSTRAVGFLLDRGVYDAIAERVEPDVPAVLPPLPPGAPRDRLALARWLVQAGHPLTARVAVNRMWQELFGIGIVDTPENFGLVGSRPTNGPLLDWLAVEFQSGGWNVKRLYKLIAMSATYRQSARVPPELLAVDPTNQLLGRGPRFRLDAEMIRDQALAASGLLVEQVGGPSVKPYQVPGIWEAAAVENQSPATYVADRGENLYRRSVYTFWKRLAPNPVLATFDAPSREVCTVRRERSNTALQALVTENATDYLEAARHLASAALRRRDATPDQRVDDMAARLLNRPLTPVLRAALLRGLDRFRGHFPTEEAARAFLSVGESPVDPLLPPVELAAWSLLASQLINSDQALNK